MPGGTPFFQFPLMIMNSFWKTSDSSYVNVLLIQNYPCIQENPTEFFRKMKLPYLNISASLSNQVCENIEK